MISRLELQERGREWGLREDVVEKDYVLGWVLWGIGTDPRLSTTWAFKGGTCLKKCYIETYRFSEDLDFTVLPGGPVEGSGLQELLSGALRRIHDESGIDFSERAPVLKTHESGRYTEGRIYYKGPRGSPMVSSIKLDLSASEVVARPTVLRRIAHVFPDKLPEPASVRCYSFEEVFAEKIRAMGERSRPRDLYDIINLYRRSELRQQPTLVRDVLLEKCRSKGVAVPTFAAIEASRVYVELEAEWANMLAHQLPALPPLADFWAELPELFAWLEGVTAPVELGPVPVGASVEEEDLTWRPPTTVWTWGVGVPLETVRFAAANRLCVELDYGGKTRVIEPYSLRKTRAGNLLLHAVKVDTREPRSYRVDRIRGVRVTNRTFTPVYRVEFSDAGPIVAPPAFRAPARGHSNGGVIYVIECPYCNREFRRTTRDFTLNAHKSPDGWKCSGSGRRGHFVDTLYE